MRKILLAFLLLYTFQLVLAQNYIENKVDAPFPMELIKEFVFPKKDFKITYYRARGGEEFLYTQGLAKAIDTYHKSGGGRVVVPAGIWPTGAIHFKGNVNFHLEENAVLCFTDNPSDYLSDVMISWEGMECYNYSPLLYAFECENIAITGKGILQPGMNLWK